MDLNLKALIGITYLIPIAITLRKIYTPCFDMPDSIARAVAKLDTDRNNPLYKGRIDQRRGFDLHL